MDVCEYGKLIGPGLSDAKDMGAFSLSYQDRLHDGCTTLVGTRSVAETEPKERLLSSKLYRHSGIHEALDCDRPWPTFRGISPIHGKAILRKLSSPSHPCIGPRRSRSITVRTTSSERKSLQCATRPPTSNIQHAKLRLSSYTASTDLKFDNCNQKHSHRDLKSSADGTR